MKTLIKDALFDVGDLYEAKCKEFVNENDLLWIIGK